MSDLYVAEGPGSVYRKIEGQGQYIENLAEVPVTEIWMTSGKNTYYPLKPCFRIFKHTDTTPVQRKESIGLVFEPCSQHFIKLGSTQCEVELTK